MNKLVIAPLLALCFLLTSFASHSNPFNYVTGTAVTAKQMSTFKVGKTTQKQVIDAIGYPARKEALGSKEVWYYDYVKIKTFGHNINEATVFEWSSSKKLLSVYKTGKAGKTGNPLVDAADGF